MYVRVYVLLYVYVYTCIYAYYIFITRYVYIHTCVCRCVCVVCVLIRCIGRVVCALFKANKLTLTGDLFMIKPVSDIIGISQYWQTQLSHS